MRQCACVWLLLTNIPCLIFNLMSCTCHSYVSETFIYLPHSPSGCTFWGKKPWSQTRKVLWQVGMLLGAPVVISLIAGIAIPVIIVGIPIYMARKVKT